MNKIDLIYIDPPYNTEATYKDKNNLSYSSNQTANKFVYRDKYARNGWLNLMRERLIKAKNLLTEKGLIFVSIDDNEQAYLKVLMDEIFDERNFVSNIVVEGGGQCNKTILFQNNYEYCLVYAKNRNLCRINKIDKIESNKSTRLDSSPTPLVTRPSMGFTIYYNQQNGDI
ncbi:MAG: site-specific DNA-methyltransferase, partial [Mycoplasma sp.]|nr:site-specific DNA-methyltransferase [Mycoplasma sp.]